MANAYSTKPAKATAARYRKPALKRKRLRRPNSLRLAAVLIAVAEPALFLAQNGLMLRWGLLRHKIPSALPGEHLQERVFAPDLAPQDGRSRGG